MQNNIIEPDDNIKVIKQTKITDWYDKLIFDLKVLAFEGIVITKWKFGDRIKKDEDKFGKPEYGTLYIENLAKDVGVDKSDLYRCLQFAKKFKYDELSNKFKNLTWKQIIKEYLPKPKDEPNIIESLPEGQYNIILADPPWSYNGNLPQRKPHPHYKTLETIEIANMPVKTIAGDNSCLFLWATFPKLPDALEVMNAWGFEYKTCAFVWIKQNKSGDGLFWGMGGWTRANAEICLLGIRGEPKRENADVHQVIMSPIEEHSKKPDEIRNRIVSLCGNLPRVELFCRNPIVGWDSWGDEIV